MALHFAHYDRIAKYSSIYPLFPSLLPPFYSLNPFTMRGEGKIRSQSSQIETISDKGCCGNYMTCRLAFNQTSTLRLHRVNLVPVSQLGNQRGTRKKGKEGMEKRGRERKREILARERKNKKKKGKIHLTRRARVSSSTCHAILWKYLVGSFAIPRGIQWRIRTCSEYIYIEESNSK